MKKVQGFKNYIKSEGSPQSFCLKWFWQTKLKKKLDNLIIYVALLNSPLRLDIAAKSTKIKL